MISSDVLHSLKDIDGVYGSFVVDAAGGLLLRDLPGVIDNGALREAGPRIARLWGAFPEDDPPDFVLLEFASHQVFIKKFELGSLCIFVPPNVNRPALRMAANFVSRWLDKQLAAAAEAVSPVSEPVPESMLPREAPAAVAQTRAAPSSVPPPGGAQSGKKRTYIFRGQRYEV
jgi:hypothetical protein